MLKNKKLISFLCTLVLVFRIVPLTVEAETKQVEIVSLSKQGDLTIMFTFDKEKVDIDFISPSGERKSSGSSDVEVAKGDLWSTYRIKNAEQGAWKAEYDLKSNRQISYSIIEDNYGLWIQYLNIQKKDDDNLWMAFQADFEGEDIYYSYEVYAVSLTDENAISKLDSGLARANTEKTMYVNLTSLSSDDYVIRLNVFFEEEGTELFDSVLSESISYNNPSEPDAIEDFKVKIDRYEHICLVDWSQFANWRHEGYRLMVTMDGQSVYNSEITKDIQTNSVLFSEGAKSIEVKLAYKRNDVWSKYKGKTINLEDEFLNNITGDITNSLQMGLQYKTIKERTLTVKINDEEGEYKVKGEGVFLLDLRAEENTVYAEMESDNQISFVFDGNVYSDRTTPVIKLYDNLDGKTFYTDKVTILGKALYGKILKINDSDVKVDATGSFAYEADLPLKENIIPIICKDTNGNETSMILTLYRGTSILQKGENGKGWEEYLPLLVSGLASILIIILSLIFMKRNDKPVEKKPKIIPWIIWDFLMALLGSVCLWQFIMRYLFSNSMGYLEMAEKSASQAAQYIKTERMYGIMTIAAWSIFALSTILTAFLISKNKSQNKDKRIL